MSAVIPSTGMSYCQVENGLVMALGLTKMTEAERMLIGTGMPYACTGRIDWKEYPRIDIPTSVWKAMQPDSGNASVALKKLVARRILVEVADKKRYSFNMQISQWLTKEPEKGGQIVFQGDVLNRYELFLEHQPKWKPNIRKPEKTVEQQERTATSP